MVMFLSCLSISNFDLKRNSDIVNFNARYCISDSRFSKYDTYDMKMISDL